MGIDKFLFLGANTADGFVGFYNKLIDMYDLKKLYILKGGSGIGKSTLITKFADAFTNHNRDFIICAGDPKSLDGVIIPYLRIGIIDGTHPHMIDPIYPGIVDEIINLGEYIDPSKVTANKRTVKELQQKKALHYKHAYAHLNSARHVHHQIEGFYKNAVNFDDINSKLTQIIMQHVDDNI